MSNEVKKKEELIEKLDSVKIHSKTVKCGRIISF
ncbi:30S ribosomal protein S5, partial [Francisella tularensis subsp. holarctica]|nr:30S ribosomal protein S5 [Francisella tularensis subsp. holarctica]